MNRVLKTGLILIIGGVLVNGLAWGFWAWTGTWPPRTAPMTRPEKLMTAVLSAGLFVPLPIIAAGSIVVISELIKGHRKKNM